ncbi:hypothetical protein R1flu_017029 [Riccia fluitans]|uniref:Uncharacterized protein n=1 Tax=Riccia fluitans TaxID=41844 RepID=A0ABD1YNI3_9MARC
MNWAWYGNESNIDGSRSPREICRATNVDILAAWSDESSISLNDPRCENKVVDRRATCRMTTVPVDERSANLNYADLAGYTWPTRWPEDVATRPCVYFSLNRNT